METDAGQNEIRVTGTEIGSEVPLRTAVAADSRWRASMMQDENSTGQSHSERQPVPAEDVAFLIVREVGQPYDVYRLAAGKVTTIGRAPTNRIVIRDEICSRHHCEVFRSGDRWILRELGSRNGTLLDGERIADDNTLKEGGVIQIGSCGLGFTFNPDRPFRNFETFFGSENSDTDGDTALEITLTGSNPEILHRQRRTRYSDRGLEGVAGRDRISRELSRLYRLALEMGGTDSADELSRLVLNVLLEVTSADIGAVLLLRSDGSGEKDVLDLVDYRTEGEMPYRRVSEYLSQTVLAVKEAILARDVAGDDELSTRDSLGELHAQSVICAPIRFGAKSFGVLHLYTSNPDNPVYKDDLEFTLAVADQLGTTLESVQQRESLAEGLARAEDENKTLRKQLEIESELVGDSPVMCCVRETISQIGPTDAMALIRGESGVGKELVARAIHFNSHRRKSPFVCMNCAALSESLLESELFGHEKGSFTGATSRKCGKFEQAHRGTLFLDEVGEMSLSIQAKFLRVLEGHPFERVGGADSIKVDVRVVAATNRDLETAVEEGAFRRDLYFRLHVVEVTVPPLRDHREDIPQLVEHFVARFGEKLGMPHRRISPKALSILTNYDWPGNVRELQNTIERAMVMTRSQEIGPQDVQLSALGLSRQAEKSSTSGYEADSLAALERRHIYATLEATEWNKTKAAEILGIERSTLDRKLKRYQKNNHNKE